MPKISVIIVNYNSGEKLRRCLDALERQLFRDFDVVIVDNASVDNSHRAAATTSLPIELINAQTNLGFAAANNLAAAQARGEWLAFLNPDAYAEPDWLATLFEATQQYPWADAFGSTQIDDAAPDFLDGAGDVLHILGFAYRGGYGQPSATIQNDGECFAPCAAAAMYRRSRFEELGGFDERFFCYLEDVDLGFRLNLQGGRAVQLCNAKVRHEGSGLTGRHSDFSVFHGNRNRIWMLYKNMPGLLYWPLAPVRAVVNLIYIGATRGRWRITLRAILAGYKGLSQFRSDRKQIQLNRKASVKQIAAALVWLPQRLFDRKVSLKPLVRAAPAANQFETEN